MAYRLRIACLLLASSALLLGSSRASAQCTKDTDCKYDRICVGGECVGPEGATGAAPNQADQKRAACKQKCEHEQSKCHGKVRDGDADARIRHHTCFVDHQRCLSDCGVSW